MILRLQIPLGFDALEFGNPLGLLSGSLKVFSTLGAEPFLYVFLCEYFCPTLRFNVVVSLAEVTKFLRLRVFPIPKFRTFFGRMAPSVTRVTVTIELLAAGVIGGLSSFIS